MVYLCTGPTEGKKCLGQAPVQPLPRKLASSAHRVGLTNTANELKTLREELKFWKLDPCSYCRPDNQVIATIRLQVFRVKTIFEAEAHCNDGRPCQDTGDKRQHEIHRTISSELNRIDQRLLEAAEAAKPAKS